jgi:hypothetical protein
MASTRHCGHCLGDCAGDCLLPGDQDLCIHHPIPPIPLRGWLRLLLSKRFWLHGVTGR